MPQTGTPSYGFQTKLGKGTAEPVTEQFNFISENLVKNQTVVDTSGLRGTRQHDNSRVRKGVYTVGGTTVMQPTPDELNKWLQYIQGGTPVVGTPAGSTTFPVGETLPDFYLWVDKVVKVHKWSGCKVDFAEFRVAQGGIMDMELGIEGKDETLGNAGTFPALTLDTDSPFMIFDATAGGLGVTSALTLGGTPRDFREMRIRIDNALIKDRHLNYQYRTRLDSIDRNVSFRALVPWTADNIDLYNAGASVAGTLVFTNGSNSLTFDFPALTVEDKSPPVQGREEMFFEVTGVLRKTASADDLKLILDLT